MRAVPMIALGMLLASAQGAAQNVLVDPTRPPMVAPSPQASAAAEPPGPQLQSVLISRGRRIVVINGKPVALGEKFGDETLVRVSETEAVLKRGAEMRVLKLYPSVEKKPVRPSAARGPRGAKGENRR